MDENDASTWWIKLMKDIRTPYYATFDNFDFNKAFFFSNLIFFGQKMIVIIIDD
jgi:hypothetical protein